MGNRNSSSNSKVHGKASKVTSAEQHGQRQGKSSASGMMVLHREQGHGAKVSAFRSDEYIDIIPISNPVPLRGKHGLGNAPLDNDDTFNDYIRRAKKKIRSTTMANNVWEQSNSAPAPVEEASGRSSKEENETEKFSNFIQVTKKKLRTTSSIRNNIEYSKECELVF